MFTEENTLSSSSIDRPIQESTYFSTDIVYTGHMHTQLPR